MLTELLAAACGVGAAVLWGAGDFSGGVASRRNSVFTVVILAQLLGGALLLVTALAVREAIPSAPTLGLGALAGLFGATGILGLYRGLAVAPMGVFAPLTALLSAILPIIVGIIWEGAPRPLQFAGFATALVAVWLLSFSGRRLTIGRREVTWAAIAGGAFGGFFILIDLMATEAVFWPLATARAASVVALAAVALATRRSLRPAREGMVHIALAGVFDSAGNALFALATIFGRLDIAAVLGALYPASTVLLARVRLQQRLRPRQWSGVLLALLALVLITLP